MKIVRSIKLLLGVCLLVAVSGCRGSQEHSVKSLFVLGDSISMGYGPFLESMLEGRMSYARKSGTEAGLEDLDFPGIHSANGGDSVRCLAYLRMRVEQGDFRPDWLLLNAGLHDLKRGGPNGSFNVAPEQYEANLGAMVRLLKEHGITPIWVRTTPIDTEMHLRHQRAFFRGREDVVMYNEIADRVMAAEGVSVIDLFGFTERFGVEAFVDHAHFSESVKQLQAAWIAGHLVAWLDGKRPGMVAGR